MRGIVTLLVFFFYIFYERYPERERRADRVGKEREREVERHLRDMDTFTDFSTSRREKGDGVDLYVGTCE